MFASNHLMRLPNTRFAGGAIWSLVTDDNLRDLVLRSGGVVAIIRAMETFPEDHAIQVRRDDETGWSEGPWWVDMVGA